MTDDETTPTVPRDEDARETPECAPAPRWRPAAEPTCCGSDCSDCPF